MKLIEDKEENYIEKKLLEGLDNLECVKGSTLQTKAQYLK